MLRTLFLAAGLLVTGCHKDPKVMTPKEGELPPLPPASGTAIGYLVDNATQLRLDDAQLKRLKEIDESLAARNDALDTQLRSIEKPDEEPGQKGQPAPRHNHAPGAQVKTNKNAARIKEVKSANEREALRGAWEVLDASQQEAAKKLLDDRGIAAPGEKSKEPTRNPDDGVPFEP
ncbi:MAG: hypothetical protein KF773_04185 [Deltaproteobacteria bacterium]|nr:hypothetical protein [Deltaproteobacteria bacterium]MCW5801411.1 hypothetical protein [Deltaproteobacteria bacterium]